ncbi:unnamed protein product [Clonostachys rhizophaga]|uniref:NACHT domain-containing protein n=1 Tax=Clonostachys rhizophaga TaxID=160324 RepID=A0A9N9VYK8_9HYPO|nr:unnamed protein product [Clonostachys rhizophaga]
MEAAGLMNQFPCLIIRGICDYSDTHKNKEWQGYAAMTAAAYTRDLLHQIQPSKVNIETKLIEFVNNECLRQWPDPPDPSVNFNKAIELRQAGSGQWLLQDSRYLSWKNSENSLLWLHGIPGCGKTVLSTTIIQYLEKEEMFLYFYFDFNDTRKQTLENMIRSLCYQLYRNKASQRHLDELTFLMMIQEAGKIYVVLDALDESSTLEDHHTRGLLSWIGSFRSSRNSVRLIATSRPEHAIQSQMDAWAGVIPVPLESHLTEGDINSYIVARVGQLSRWHARTDIQDEIIFALSSKANGILPGSSNLKKSTLKSLLRTLDQTYSRILESVPLDHRHYTIRLLQFLTFSDRPLRIEEAVDAIAVNTNEKPYFNPEDRMPVPEEVLSYCSSLVAMTNRRGPNARYEIKGFKELSLAHFSVKEYLISDRFQQDDRMKDVGLDFLETNARASIVKVCVAYLLGVEALIYRSPGVSAGKFYHLMFAEEGEKTVIQQEYPIAQYAAKYWPEHARLAKNIGEAKSLIWDLMQSAAYYINWALYDPASRFFRTQPGVVFFAPKVYYATLFGLTWLVEGLLEDGADVNAKGDDGTALNVALDRGHGEILHLLLQAGADADAPNEDGDTPLHVVVRRGRGGMVRWLPEHTTYIGAIGSTVADGITLLQEGVRDGHVKIIRQLLEHGADINGMNLDGTALRWTVSHGNYTIVQLLIKYGADLDLAGRYGGIPLQAAVHYGHGNIVQCLLENGADADLVSKDQGSTEIFYWLCQNRDKLANENIFNERNTPLYLAATYSDEKMVQQLLKHGADINAISTNDNSNETALEGALAGGHIEIAQQLIEHGANVDARSKRHGSALYQAVTKGFGHIVEQLLDLGADPSVAGTLHEAVSRGHEGMIKQLIDYGADIDSYSEAHEGTPLCAAVCANRNEIVQLLLQNGANVNGTELSYGFALHQAAMGGQVTILQQLLDQGADVNVTGYNDNRTALQAAVFHGRHDAVLQLLQHGAKVNETGNQFDGPALTIAAAEGYSEIVHQLLEYDADMNAIDGSEGTALQAAASHGRSEIVQLLLNRAADVSLAAGNIE